MFYERFVFNWLASPRPSPTIDQPSFFSHFPLISRDGLYAHQQAHYNIYMSRLADGHEARPYKVPT